MTTGTGGLLDAEAIAATAADLIAFNSTGGHERPVLDHIAAWLDDHGVAVKRQVLPWAQLATHPLASAEVERDHVDVLVAEAAGRGARSEGQAGGQGATLLLNAHVDIIPAHDEDGRVQVGWSGPPMTAVRSPDGWLRGRGAADTKGGMAAAMHVMAALAAAGGPPSGRVLLTPVVGEEDGGCGTLATLLTGVHADGAVVIEPTDLAVARASAGALCFRVTVSGRTAHGSVRHQGVSAIEKLLPIHQRILELERERAGSRRHALWDDDVPFPICVGRIEGGDYRCDEAAWALVEGRMGTPPDEPVAEARAALETVVAEAAAADPWLGEHPPTVEWIGAQWVGGDTPADARIVQLAAEIARRSPSGVSFGCDLGLLRQAAGIPGVVYGPGSASVAHAPDERVLISDLGRFAVALHEMAIRFCA